MTGTRPRRTGTVENASQRPVASILGPQTLILDGFPTAAQVRLLGPNGGHGNRYAVSTCRQNVKARVKIEVGRQGIVPVSPPVQVILRYVMPDRRARDEDNFAAIAKPVIDGLVKAGILEGDDSKRLTECVVFGKVTGVRRLEVVLTLAPHGAAEGGGGE
jgi:hypothetical protein